MGRVTRKPRVVKFQTRTHPTISWSTNGEIPRKILHRIKGNLSVTYTPDYLDDLENKITYELSDDDKEVFVFVCRKGSGN